MKLSPPQLERLTLLMEEMAEAQQAIGKIIRHGYDAYHPNAIPGALNNRGNLEREVGHVLAALEIMYRAGDVLNVNITDHRDLKYETVKEYLHYNVHYVIGRWER